MEDYLKAQDTAFSFIAYVGDGGNDFCPALRYTLPLHKSIFVEYFCIVACPKFGIIELRMNTDFVAAAVGMLHKNKIMK